MGVQVSKPARLSVLLALTVVACFAAEDSAQVGTFESLIQAGKFAEAKAGLETYTASNPDSWRSQYQLGYVYFRLHMIQPSVNSLCKSLVLNTNFAESHKILAYDLNILGHQDLALRELERAIKLNPNSAESYYESGRIYYERGSYLEAISNLEHAKAIDPNSIRTYHNLGLAYAALREDEKAVANFEEGLRRNSHSANLSAWPLIDYATYRNLQGQFEKAKELLLQSLTIEKTWDQAYDELSKAYRGLGQPAEAIEALQHAIALNPKKSIYHYVLARLYTQVHQPNEAKAEIAQYEREHGARSPPE